MILLVGGLGSIGRRYQAILKHLGAEFVVHDENAPQAKPFSSLKYTKAIIATPTPTHLVYCREFIFKKVPFLCEKPLSFFPDAVTPLYHHWKTLNAKGYVVNNYSFLRSEQGFEKAPKSISYNFFNTGRDGLIWDVCQLLYLAKNLECPLTVRTDSFQWALEWGSTPVPYHQIERSYLEMMKAFLDDKVSKLWNFEAGMEMTQLCHDLEEELQSKGFQTMKMKGKLYEGFDWDPSKKRIVAFTAEDLPKHRA